MATENRIEVWNGEVFDAPPGTRLFVCDLCGFTFDAVHVTQGTDSYSCPLCEVFIPASLEWWLNEGGK